MAGFKSRTGGARARMGFDSRGQVTFGPDYFGSGGFQLYIDSREIKRLGEKLSVIGRSKGRAAIRMAVNKGARNIKTRISPMIQHWMGHRKISRIRKDVHIRYASDQTLIGGVWVAGRHSRISKGNYGAAWRRSWAGGKHSAWNKPQIADGSFLVKKVGGGTLFKRTSAKRFPIKPLWGPHPAKEVIRHPEQINTLLVEVKSRVILPEVRRLLGVELARLDGKYGMSAKTILKPMR